MVLMKNVNFILKRRKYTSFLIFHYLDFELIKMYKNTKSISSIVPILNNKFCTTKYSLKLWVVFFFKYL